MNAETGKYVIFGGILMVIAGASIYFFHDKLNWPGHLPGDIRIEKENFRFYFPVTTMILLSVVVSALIHFIKKFL